MGLSAVVITCNEESNIARCLESLSFADEIVVLDSFSTDRTVEIARRYTDNVSSREFAGFSDQKNAALALARQDWVLVIDADEVVSPELADEIRAAVASREFDAYQMPRSTEFIGRRLRFCGWSPDYQLRLALRSKARFPFRLVHERMEVDGCIGTLNGCIIHYSYPDIETCARKMSLYGCASARQKMLEGRRFRWIDLVVSPPLAFLRMYIVKQGFRDGAHGFINSIMSACAAVYKQVALWDLSRRR